jgi:AmmeMemoRadiSam system protein B
MVGRNDEHEPTDVPRPPVTRVRPPRFAGSHYPSDPTELRATIEGLLGPPSAAGPRLLGLVLPHGPWRMVGSLIAEALLRGLLEENVIILAPNHAGRGPRSSIVCDGGYSLPGPVTIPIEQTLAESVRALGGLTEAPEVFTDEHAIEDLLPLLYARQPRIAIVPIAIHDVSAASAARIGPAIADAVVGRGGGVTLIATTDLAHYVPRDRVEAESKLVTDAASALDADALVDVFARRAAGPGPILETCGLGALLTFVHALRALGAAPGEIVARADSGEFEPDARSAVAWASLSFVQA